MPFELSVSKYHKIPTVWKRDPENNYKTLIEGAWATPEIEYLARLDWVATEKVDGTNIRAIWDGERITFAGKTDNAQIPAPLFARLQEIFTAERMKVLRGPICLYGEGYGARIQEGGGYIRDGVDFVLFDAYAGMWLKQEDVAGIAAGMGIAVVPAIYSGPLLQIIEIVAGGYITLIGDDRMAEGAVMRPRVELADRAGRRVITKVKTKDFQREG